MTTEKLIELGKICGHDCGCPSDCPYYHIDDDVECTSRLLAYVTDELEKMYTYIGQIRCYPTCVENEEEATE